jgi:hypothetical protein
MNAQSFQERISYLLRRYENLQRINIPTTSQTFLDEF